MEKDEEFEVIRVFQNFSDDCMESDYMGTMDVKSLLNIYPEISDRELEEIKTDGEGIIFLNDSTGNMIKLNYLNEEE